MGLELRLLCLRFFLKISDVLSNANTKVLSYSENLYKKLKEETENVGPANMD